MTRLAIIAGVFLAITAGLILMQPGSSTDGTNDTAQVARASTDLTAIKTPAPTAPRPAPAAKPEPAPNAADADLSAAVLNSLGNKSAPKQATKQAPDAKLLNLTASVLNSLDGEAPAPAADNSALRGMTSSVLAGLGGNSGGAPATAKKPSMQSLVVQALAQGQSDAYIDALLNEAAGRGQVAVPAALRTADGKVDTATLLAQLVRKSSDAGAQGDTDLLPSATPLAAYAGAGLKTTKVKQDGKTVARHTYTVQTGDSLGAIAQRLYGDARYFSAIFDANRKVLISPDQIRVGQRLSIPDLNAT